MKISKVKITNFKCYEETFTLALNDGLNVIVGANESGKTTILEAIHLALTGLLHGRPLKNDLTSYLFNLAAQNKYVRSLGTASPLPPPAITIELFFSGSSNELAELEGDGNSEKAKDSGVVYKIEFDEESYKGPYEELVKAGALSSIPVEYYITTMRSFARRGITARNIPIKSALIDSSSTRLQNGSDVYVSRIIRDVLEEKERASISQAHRKLKETFVSDPNLKLINDRITQAAKISQKAVSISVDLSSQTAWESSLMTYIDLIPFQYIGKGEQCVIKTKLALSTKKNAEATAILVEEPENHLSHARLNELIADLTDQHGQKQIIISTHSSFVANKLGLDHLIVLRGGEVARISELKASDFFKKLAGYDTLRLALAAKAILVEGDSDELVVQRAYMDANGGRLPIQDGIDVISVGTAFLRFLELASALKIPVAVVTDNDGDTAAVEKKYAAFKDSGTVRICFDPVVDTGALMIKDKPFNYNTLEPKLLKPNDRAMLNTILGTSATADDELRIYMRANKTESALAIFNSTATITYPDYIQRAIAP
ncbi:MULTISPECIES: ATP-dependent nuclease [Phyllobacteriaceae]|jgi:putative ATP-dependent endonuclease of the OLD family|uniref:ATP-dependent endonuclease n=1 Tax=Mesorhizobium hungaricum TaxID=1566387 RepID=A0A1C2EED6_9HYPH|nr:MULTISPECIES: AAA family ATPase [Mesorhizobium]MBN9237772.1 AAA family ATPase [Mesorhizobium sp.]MDQ0327723.1 putative ATPase [Mesorhizobium sp. YL-MeA3-2017]OCX25306.1 ATP-dependent endonuclease [Mesorhizobium hungaricum]